jgi:hypothetical protein
LQLGARKQQRSLVAAAEQIGGRAVKFFQLRGQRIAHI